MVPLTLFTTAVPLPFGRLGLSEQVSQELFKLVEHPGGALAMMGFRVLMYGGGVVCAGVYLANLRQVRGLTADRRASRRRHRSTGTSTTPEDALRPARDRVPSQPTTLDREKLAMTLRYVVMSSSIFVKPSVLVIWLAARGPAVRGGTGVRGSVPR